MALGTAEQRTTTKLTSTIHYQHFLLLSYYKSIVNFPNKFSKLLLLSLILTACRF